VPTGLSLDDALTRGAAPFPTCDLPGDAVGNHGCLVEPPETRRGFDAYAQRVLTADWSTRVRARSDSIAPTSQKRRVKGRVESKKGRSGVLARMGTPSAHQPRSKSTPAQLVCLRVQHCSNCCTCGARSSRGRTECPGAQSVTPGRSGHKATACLQKCRICGQEGHPNIRCPNAKARGRSVEAKIILSTHKSAGMSSRGRSAPLRPEQAASWAALPDEWKKLGVNERRVRKRARYSGVSREEARQRKPLSSATDVRRAGHNPSLIDLLQGPVNTMMLHGWCSLELPKCGKCGADPPTGTSGNAWTWQCPCKLVRWGNTRAVVGGFPSSLTAKQAAVVLWCFNAKIPVGKCSSMAGACRRVARTALNALTKAAARFAWEQQKHVRITGIAEFDEHSLRTVRVGLDSTFTAEDGTKRPMRGPGHVYVRYLGVVGRSTREFAMYELPDEISPLTVANTPGAPHPLSLAELHSTGLLKHVPTQLRSADSAPAYAREVTAAVNHNAKEWTRRTESGFVAGTQYIDSVWKVVDSEIPTGTNTMRRELLRCAAYCGIWRYRFQNDPVLVKNTSAMQALGDALEYARRTYGELGDVPAPPAFWDYADRVMWTTGEPDQAKAPKATPPTPAPETSGQQPGPPAPCTSVVASNADCVPEDNAADSTPPQPFKKNRPRLKGDARKQHMLIQAGQRSRVEHVRDSAGHAARAQQARSTDFFNRAVNRVEEAEKAVGDGNTCPTCKKEFKDNASARRHYSLTCAPWCQGVYHCTHPACANRPPFTGTRALSAHWGRTHPETSKNTGTKKAPTAAKTRNVGEAVRAAAACNPVVPEDMQPTAVVDPPAREYLASKYMHPVLRRCMERRAAAVNACPATGKTRERDEASRTCKEPGCGAVCYDVGTLRNKHWTRQHWDPVKHAGATIPWSLRVSIENHTAPRMPTPNQLKEDADWQGAMKAKGENWDDTLWSAAGDPPMMSLGELPQPKKIAGHNGHYWPPMAEEEGWEAKHIRPQSNIAPPTVGVAEKAGAAGGSKVSKRVIDLLTQPTQDDMHHPATTTRTVMDLIIDLDTQPPHAEAPPQQPARDPPPTTTQTVRKAVIDLDTQPAKPACTQQPRRKTVTKRRLQPRVDRADNTESQAPTRPAPEQKRRRTEGSAACATAGTLHGAQPQKRRVMQIIQQRYPNGAPVVRGCYHEQQVADYCGMHCGNNLAMRRVITPDDMSRAASGMNGMELEECQAVHGPAASPDYTHPEKGDWDIETILMAYAFGATPIGIADVPTPPLTVGGIEAQRPVDGVTCRGLLVVDGQNLPGDAGKHWVAVRRVKDGVWHVADSLEPAAYAVGDTDVQAILDDGQSMRAYTLWTLRTPRDPLALLNVSRRH